MRTYRVVRPRDRAGVIDGFSFEKPSNPIRLRSTDFLKKAPYKVPIYSLDTAEGLELRDE